MARPGHMNPIRSLARFLAVLTALIMPVQLAAQTAAAAPAAHPALWKIADADTTIYLFGTIHLLPQGVDWYTGPIAAAFGSSGDLVTEIPEYGDTETTSAVVRYGILPEKQTLRGLMSKKERTRYEAALRGMGLPPQQFDRYQPWYAAVALATLPLQRSGFDMSNGVESHLSALAKAAGKPRTGLETLDMQLGLFGAFNTKVQKRYLFDTIGSLPTIPQEIRKMVDSWARGDAPALAELINSDQNDPAMMKALLLDRNKAWAQWITTRLNQPGTTFVAVGAGHLGGKGSVQEVLARSGIAATRVQ